MIINRLDSIQFRLREQNDFSWLKKYGSAFWALDETGSGCVCIGMQDGEKKYFCKIAGANTIEAEVSPEESVKILKAAVRLYSELAHPNLTRIVEEYDHDRLYVVVFEWAEGECLFDHWNFEKYHSDTSIKSPGTRFRELPADKKLKAAEVLFSFLEQTDERGYVAVDFYDGSIMYDFATDRTTICDIDFFRKAPAVNDKGSDWFGTKRLKAPEEYIKDAVIDRQTNIFTLGALLFEFFGSFTEEDIRRRYIDSRFVPCDLSGWQLSEESYRVAARAVSPDRDERYRSFGEFHREWDAANAN